MSVMNYLQKGCVVITDKCLKTITVITNKRFTRSVFKKSAYPYPANTTGGCLCLDTLICLTMLN